MYILRKYLSNFGAQFTFKLIHLLIFCKEVNREGREREREREIFLAPYKISQEDKICILYNLEANLFKFSKNGLRGRILILLSLFYILRMLEKRVLTFPHSCSYPTPYPSSSTPPPPFHILPSPIHGVHGKWFPSGKVEYAKKYLVRSTLNQFMLYHRP